MAMAYKEDPHKLGAPKGSMNSKGTGRGHGKSTGNINANSRNGGTKEAVKSAPIMSSMPKGKDDPATVKYGRARDGSVLSGGWKTWGKL
jgi:hypothetical protein